MSNHAKEKSKYNPLLLVCLVKVIRDVLLELVDQKRGTLRSPPLVSNGIFYFHLVQDRAVIELDEERIADGALGGIMVVDRVALVLNTVDLGAERVDARVRGRFVGVALRSKLAVDEGVGNHVVDGVAVKFLHQLVPGEATKGNTYSRSAKLSRGPCLSMILTAASWVLILTLLMSSAVLPNALSLSWMMWEASTAVWAWNSAGYEILNRTFSMMYEVYGIWNSNGLPCKLRTRIRPDQAEIYRDRLTLNKTS